MHLWKKLIVYEMEYEGEVCVCGSNRRIRWKVSAENQHEAKRDEYLLLYLIFNAMETSVILWIIYDSFPCVDRH